MTETKQWLSFKRLPWRTRTLVALLGLCALVISVTTIFIIIQIIRIQWQHVDEAVNPPQVPQAAAHEAPVVEPFTQVYELQGMTISLGNRNQTLAAYAEFNLALDCPTKEARRWIEMNRASLRDAVYESTVSFTVEDFNSPEGFSRIKKSILDGLKARFGAFAPRDLMIRDWVIR